MSIFFLLAFVTNVTIVHQSVRSYGFWCVCDLHPAALCYRYLPPLRSLILILLHVFYWHFQDRKIVKDDIRRMCNALLLLSILYIKYQNYSKFPKRKNKMFKLKMFTKNFLKEECMISFWSLEKEKAAFLNPKTKKVDTVSSNNKDFFWHFKIFN